MSAAADPAPLAEVPAAWADLTFFRDDWPAIAAHIAAEDRPVYPPAPRIFAALQACAPRDVRVVILGQDPYHSPGKADGLAFSIAPDFRGPLGSLGNIFRELRDDLGVERTRQDLSDWAEQGVLLLNTALSVPAGQPKGHARIGWDRLVAQVLARLDDTPRAFLLWGGPAQSIAARHLKNPDHLKVMSAHPSPLSAHRGFFGSRPFSRVNEWLIAHGQAPIRWA
ncbi:uracil-DNA glycosylase [Albidovulum inexpectatum]|uniref:Uracil-DNA glycosylase n=1 Tax=Albidovulum inexpectatum TaxID=196587 RepID=A0A2S5JJY1_9RHOB|nr:uracil-DNA glycosylase [Albidovulum inexpectatum]PPB81688.1 uracil-DNA glycosylase [Albidovulum inexpectatum]